MAEFLLPARQGRGGELPLRRSPVGLRSDRTCQARAAHWRSGAANARWFPIDDLPQALAFDHARILADALTALRARLRDMPLVPRMLPTTFTLSALQAATEAVLGEALDKRNFRRQVLEAGWLSEADGTTEGRGRPAQLYRLREEAVGVAMHGSS